MKDRNNEFDDLVRDILLADEAGIKVPRRVRRAVLCRAGGERVSRTFVFAPLAALAAALACLFVVLKPSSFESGGSIRLASSLSVKVEDKGEIERLLGCVIPSPEDITIASFPKRRSPLPQQEPSPFEEEREPSGVETVREPSATAREEAPKSSTSQRAFRPVEGWTESFRQEQKRSEKPLSLSFGGSLASQGNGKDNNFSTSYSSGFEGLEMREDTKSQYAVPLSFGVSLRYRVTERFSVAAGLDWTSLSRTFEGSYRTAAGTFTHNVQYLGLPLSAYYDILHNKATLFYLQGGGSIGKCISSRYYLRKESSKPILEEKIPRLQCGLFFGVGAEFRLWDGVGLFIDPTFSFFSSDGQPTSKRTANPLSFSLEAGLRYQIR